MSTNSTSPATSLRLLAGPALALKVDQFGRVWSTPRHIGKPRLVGALEWTAGGCEKPSLARRGSALAALWCVRPREAPIYLIRIGRIVLVFRSDGDDPPWGDLLASIQRRARSPEEIETVRCVLERAYPAESPEIARLEGLLPRRYRRLRAGLEDPVVDGLRIHGLLPDSPVACSPAATFETARGILARAMPFLTAAVYYLQPVERPGLGTATVDPGGRCFYDPGWAESLGPAQFAGVLNHEISHLLRFHFKRGALAEAEPMLWNLACDLEINDELIPAGAGYPRGTTAPRWAQNIRLPGNAVRPLHFGFRGKLLAEEYYRLLCSMRSLDGRLTGRQVASGRCGGVAGNPERWEPTPESTPGDQPPTSEDADGGQPTPSSLLAVEQVADRVADAIVRISNSRYGSVPGEWQRWAETHLRPKHDWRAELARLLLGAISHASGMVDYTYRRPSRRAAAAYPAVLPSLVMPRIEVAVVVDTSASMDEKLLGQALSELEGILAANGRSTATVYAVDTEVQDIRRVRSASDIQLTGGGGTDMGVGIARAAEQRPRPGVIVVLTDGVTPWPTKAPAMPVIVGIIEPQYRRDHGISVCGGLYPGNRASSGGRASFGPTAPRWARVVAITSDDAT